MGYLPGAALVQRRGRALAGGHCEVGRRAPGSEMHFLPDVYVTCEVCRGKRWQRGDAGRAKWKDRSIAEVLDTSVSDAFALFEHHRGLMSVLKTLEDVGLGYIALRPVGDHAVGR